MPISRSRLLASATAALTGLLVVAVPAPASAHSLDSSTLSVHLGEDTADITVSVAVEALQAALGTATLDTTALDTAAAVSYLDEHLSVSGADGTTWAETWSDPVQASVEGIDSLTVQVALDPAGADPSALTLAYDAVVEADPGHQAVVVLTDAAGEVSTAGVLDAADSTLSLGTTEHGLVDMVGLGLHHVLEGADHLLFLVTLLLVAPLAVRAGRWTRRDGVLPTARSVLGVATAFTVGHSLTLIASALGWVAVPSRPVEVLIAASVAVSAVHALRPLVRHGEQLIAGGFGLVHGLAFAGILADLGLAGTTSLPSLLAFNVGVELAQVVTIALVLPSLVLASGTRWYTALRVSLAGAALAAATGWALDRLGVLADPLAGVEDAVVAHLVWVVVALAAVAIACRLADRPARQPVWA